MNPLIKRAYASFFILFAPLFLQQQVFAQDAMVRLSGTITDSLSGNPVSGAVVALPELSRSVVSDGGGAFVLDGVSPSLHFMIVTAKGYSVKRIGFAVDDISAPIAVKLSKNLSPFDANAATMPPQTPDTANFASQTRPISGKVIDKKTGQPIPQAIISIAASNVAVLSGQGGEFSISVPAAACTLITKKTGFEQLSVPVDSGSKKASIEIALSQSSVYELQDMDVNAGRIETKQMVATSEKISQVKMTPELVKKLPNVGQPDLFRSLQLLPGVMGTNEMTSELFIRGGTPDQNLILLDRIPIYYVNHFYGFYSAFNPDGIDSVTIHKGGFGAQYGGRLSSVVELSSRGIDMVYDSNEVGVKAGVGCGLLSGDAYVQAPIINKNIGTLMIAGRRSMVDIFKTNLFNKLFNRMHGSDTINTFSNYGMGMKPIYSGFPPIDFEPKFNFWDLNGLAAFKLGSRGKLSFTFFGSQDKQDNSIDTLMWQSYAYPRINYIPDSNSNIDPKRDPMKGPFGYRLDTVGFDTNISVMHMKNNAPISWGNRCFGQEWDEQWSDAYKTRLNLSYSQFLDEKTEDKFTFDSVAYRHSDTIAPYDTSEVHTSWMTSQNKITDYSGRFDNSIKFSDSHTLNLGVEISRKAVTYERDTANPDTNSIEWQMGMRFPQVPAVKSYDTSVSIAVYAEDAMSFGDKASLTPGLRLYHFQLAEAYALDPRISGWYKLFPDFKAKAAWGLYTQEIHRAEEEDITGGSKFVWLLTTPQRPLEKSQQLVGGFSWEKEHFLFDAEAYVKSITGLLTISERNRYYYGPWLGNPFDPHQLALFEGTGLAKGVDVLAQIKNLEFPLFSKNTVFDGWAAYTWSKVENTYAVFNGGNPFPASQDRTHEVKLIGNLEWNFTTWSSIDLGAVWLYSTGAPYTAPLGYYSLMPLDSSYVRRYLRVSDKNFYRLPDYHRLDVSLSWKVHFGKHVQSSLSVGFFNVYNHENTLERTYNETTNFGGTAVDSYYKPITPTTEFVPVDKKAFLIFANTALEITAQF